ncbi:Nuclear receptor coactivator 5 isoform 1 [Schistosoma japonicum]|uniref:Nuclear receptor coactivator 5 isoform 1 n=1 Tax=Schistosoma japonicum TaxID=6182 RepID=A0A4Z2D7E2_SCHJA|nr:Nuclear receptor coactivator 5 [Schistosoma japonicum]TNN12403.1 Nuclear receptor coactivator 5 isoform 1 [Schistosoma japonicum]
MGTRGKSPDDGSCLVGKVLIEDLPKRAISHNDIRDWLKKYGNISEIIIYSRCLLVQFDSDIEAAGAVQCENGASLFGTKVSLKHMEAGDLKALRRAGPPIDRFSTNPQRHSGSISDRDRDRERDKRRGSLRRDRLRDRTRSPDKRARDTSPRHHSRSPNITRADRRTVHPLNWLSEVAERDKKLNGSSLLGPANKSTEKSVAKSPPYVVAIITVQHDLVPYAEIIEQRVSKSLTAPGSPSVTHIVVLLSVDHLSPCLADLTKDGVPFAIICTMTNWAHNSCTLRILYAPTQQEHRNMPLDDALILLQREYSAYTSSSKDEVNTAPPEDSTFMPPSRHLASLLRMLADSRVLSVGELDEISAFVQERKRRLEGRRNANNNISSGNENTAELKSRILSMLYPQSASSTVTTNTTSSHIPVDVTHQTQALTTTSIGSKLAENLTNPIVQKAIDTLMSYPSNSMPQTTTQKTLTVVDTQNVQSKNSFRSNIKPHSSSSAASPYPSTNIRQTANWSYEDNNGFRPSRPPMSNEFNQHVPYSQNTRPNLPQSREYPSDESRKGPSFVEQGGQRGVYRSEFEAHEPVLDSNSELFEENAYPGWPRRKRKKRGGKAPSGDSYQYLDPKSYSRQNIVQPSQQPVDLMSTEVHPVGTVAEAYKYSQIPPLMFNSGIRGRSQRMVGGGSSYNSYNYQTFGSHQPNNLNMHAQPYGYPDSSSFY